MATCIQFRPGEVLGRISLSCEMVRVSAMHAAQAWDVAVAEQFCGDAVTTFMLPESFPDVSGLIPGSVLRPFGLQIDPAGRQELVTTYGVDPHEDDIHGLVLFLVLHNDGLAFRQGKVRHATQAGEFFVFNDRKSHSVTGVRGRGMYLGWSIPVRSTVASAE